MVENYRTDMSPEPINVPEVRKDNGRVILKVGGSINDIYANTFLKKDSQGYVEIKQDGSYGLEQGEPVFLGKTSPDFNLGWSNSLSYKGFGLSFLINGRFGGVVTSSTQLFSIASEYPKHLPKHAMQAVSYCPDKESGCTIVLSADRYG